MVYFAYGSLGLITSPATFGSRRASRLRPRSLPASPFGLRCPGPSNGVRRARGHSADFRLTTKILHRNWRGPDGLGSSHPCRCRWQLAHLARPEHLYVLGALLLSIGTVVQDVVADAMSTEVVERTDASGNDRPDHDVRVELGMVQLLGRLAVSAGVLAVAGLSGWLANFISRQGVFLIGLIIPAFPLRRVFAGT